MDREEDGAVSFFVFPENSYTDVDAEKRKSRQNQILRAMEHKINWFELVNELQKLKKELPYHINLMDELHANENTHTRILLKLLSYKDRENGQYTILTSFLHLLSDYNYEVPTLFENPRISFGKDFIDGTIIASGTSGEKFGIIIENKIYGAKDQYKQIERYIESVHKQGILYENIFVIYLTSDGYKRIESCSLTSEAKKLLNMTDGSNGRFIPINYRDDILPWLQNNILPNCKLKEEYLLSAIQQYIDYLEGLFNIRKINTKTNNIMTDKLFKEMGLTNSSTTTDKYNKIVSASRSLQDIQSILNNELDTIKNDFKNAFAKITNNYFQQFREIGINNSIELLKDGFFFINCKGWGWEVHFEWCPISINKLIREHTYTFNLHTEGVLEPFKKVLLNDVEFKQTVEQIDGNTNINDKVTVFRKVYQVEKTFAEMTYDEQKTFLEKAYKDITPMIPIIDRLLAEYKNKK